ncbi:class I SAM-dependent methyltransferase [Rhizobiales bacterium]|uniref:class I SAM-dependent methyltransferase n=1 Tax=Hongsoonwoonella zoysiae TaxID=2821844 RepID=UPI0015618FD2|nr:class I SAM-dependent methyltransferase [Hongsoonwoonella zoysiae]NRG18142.1 class I SAM-dependent methyltransferase [Hongsoonwoonella zoysiae]
MTDPLLKTLFLPFSTGRLDWPGDAPALFLRARADAGLDAVGQKRLVCVQSFRPHADAVAKAGFRVEPALPEDDTRYPLVLVLPPRQREEARALLAEALSHTMEGGVVVAAQPNTEGAKTGESDLKALAGNVESLSKNKCRVFWTTAEEARQDTKLLQEWRSLDTPRPVVNGRFMSRPGVFAWDRIDPGTALLAKHLPQTLSGHAADLGAGIGVLSVLLLARCPHITSLDLYEAEARALDLARENLLHTQEDGGPKLGFHWHDVTRGLHSGPYDVIVMNPPFHESRASRADIGQAFIREAAKVLKPGGRLYLVANRQLPYEATIKEHFTKSEVLADEAGYKVIAATRSGRKR